MEDFQPHSDTLDRIRKSALSEFQEKGYQAASLRNIVKEAGVTTGAFYGYFKSKEELFSALVEKEYRKMRDHYQKVQEDFSLLPLERQRADMKKVSEDCLEWMLHYAFENLEIFRLILLKSDGTPYSHLVDDMVETEERSTEDFLSLSEKHGYQKPEINPLLKHSLTTGLFSSFTELIIHDIPYEEALRCLLQLQRFYTAGWRELLGEVMLPREGGDTKNAKSTKK